MNKFDYLFDRKIYKKLDEGKLRIIAMLSMFLDHVAFMVIGNGMLYGYNIELFEAAIDTSYGKNLYMCYLILRSIGRISFPIFAFMLVEGFNHTRSVFRYAVRLLVLAVISEIPFNLMCGNRIFYPEKQNVVFTLLLSLVMLYFIRRTDKYNYIVRSILNVLLVVITCLISFFCKLDYNYLGVMLIYFIYVFRIDKNLKFLIMAILTFFMSFVEPGSFRYFGAGILSVIPLYIYNGRPGKLYKHAWLYYSFYPLHMIILYMVVFFNYL